MQINYYNIMRICLNILFLNKEKSKANCLYKPRTSDLSITRTTFDWGIPMPNDKEHVIYVWIDALSNYLTVAQYGDDVNFKLRWTDAEVVHFLGKDILRFHAIILHAMLMSLGVKVSDKIFYMDNWTIEGEKDEQIPRECNKSNLKKLISMVLMHLGIIW